MPRKSDKTVEPQDFKVFIRNPHGKYLARDDHGLFFTDDRAAAMVFDYGGDSVAQQLELIGKTHGLVLTPDPVPLEEIYERCDRCRDWFMPFMIFFDGTQFLCPDCRPRPRPRLSRP